MYVVKPPQEGLIQRGLFFDADYLNSSSQTVRPSILSPQMADRLSNLRFAGPPTNSAVIEFEKWSPWREILSPPNSVGLLHGHSSLH